MIGSDIHESLCFEVLKVFRLSSHVVGEQYVIFCVVFLRSSYLSRSCHSRSAAGGHERRRSGASRHPCRSDRSGSQPHRRGKADYRSGRSSGGGTGDSGADQRVRILIDRRTFPAVFCGWYIGGMKEKTSVTLSKEVLSGIDRVAGSKQSRSAFIEAVLAQYLRQRARAERGARDLAIINRSAERLNRDALDGLERQAPIGDFPEE